MTDLTPGQTFSAPERTISALRILAFSGGPLDAPGWPARNLHTDAAKAAEAGLAAPIVSGIQCESDIVRLLESIFGEAWFRAGQLHVKYPRPVTAGMSIQAHACVRTVTPAASHARVELDVWCETPDGTKVVVGTATGPANVK